MSALIDRAIRFVLASALEHFNLHILSGLDRFGGILTEAVREFADVHKAVQMDADVDECAELGDIGDDANAELTNKRLRRASFLSVDDLVTAIEDFLTTWNQNPKPFVWTATLDSILAKLTRCRQTLEQIQPGCTAPKKRKPMSS
jgi:hypothetical protein